MSTLMSPRERRLATMRHRMRQITARVGLWQMARMTRWPIVLFFVLLLVPPEFDFHVGSMRLSFYRIYLIVMFLPCAWSVWMPLNGRIPKADIFIILQGVWMIVAFSRVHDLRTGIESGGVLMLETLGAYLLARRYVRDIVAFRGMVAVWTLSVIAMVMVTVPGAIMHVHIIREMFGGTDLHWKLYETRMGLMRALGPFEHSILYGVYCASVLGACAYAFPRVETWKKVLRLGLIWVAAFVSFSAGALACMVVQIQMVVYERFTRRVPHRWWILGAMVLLAYVAIDLGSNRKPIEVMIHYLTFDRGTAYNRLLIWEYGSAEALRHPFFGIGFNDWTRPAWMSASGSMDNFWLLLAVRYGIPCFLFTAAGIVAVAYRMIKLKRIHPDIDGARMGWIISMIGIFIAGATVHFWNALYVLLFFFIGAGYWIGQSVSKPAARRPAKLSKVPAKRV